MLTKSWIDALPLWALLVVTVLFVLAAIEGGYRLAAFHKGRSDEAIDAPIGSVIGGTLGLLGFLLAFTFGIAASRFDSRRELLLNEVNAISTCYLRAELVTDPERVEIRKRLREYAQIRAGVKGGFVTMRAETLFGEAINSATGTVIPANTPMLFPNGEEHIMDRTKSLATSLLTRSSV